MKGAAKVRGWVVVVTGGLAGACAEPEAAMRPSGSEPARVIVEPAEGARLCAGTEAWAEQEIARVEQQIGLLPAYELVVTLGDSAVADRCVESGDPQTVLGCTVGDGAATTVSATLPAFSHELVHALRRHAGLETQAMFEEGFAEWINGSDPLARSVVLDPGWLSEQEQPEALVHLGYSRFRRAQNYLTATHLFDFMEQARGAEALAAFMVQGVDRSGDAASARFEAHFGVSLADEAQAWRDAGLQAFGRGDPCGAGVESSVPGDDVSVQATVDCDEDDVMGLEGDEEVMWTRRCVELSAGIYDARLTTGSGVARLEPVRGSCASDSSASGMGAHVIEAGQPDEVALAACTWAVSFASTRGQPESFELTLSPR